MIDGPAFSIGRHPLPPLEDRALTRLAPLFALLFTSVAQATPVVEQLDDGWWTTEQPSGLAVDDEAPFETNVWVDYALQNWSYHKDTGIVWTVDGWATVNEAEGWYEGALSDGREVWGVDIRPLVVPQSAPPGQTAVFQYAVFYTVDGVTHWDNDGGADFAIEVVVDR